MRNAARAAAAFVLLAVFLCGAHAQMPSPPPYEGTPPPPSPGMSPSPSPPGSPQFSPQLFSPVCWTTTILTEAGEMIELNSDAPVSGPVGVKGNSSSCRFYFQVPIGESIGHGVTISFPETMPEAEKGAHIILQQCSGVPGDEYVNCVKMETPQAGKVYRAIMDVISVELVFNATEQITSDYFPMNVSIGKAPSVSCPGEQNNTCADKYATLYGCNVDFFELPPEDECYEDIVINRCHLAGQYCNDCATQCAINKDYWDPVTNMPRTTWQLVSNFCRPACAALNEWDPRTPYHEFCAPGCRIDSIGDGKCSGECNNADCFHDGGECYFGPMSRFGNKKVLTRPYFDLGAEIDQDLDGVASREEMADGFQVPFAFEYLDFNDDGSLDDWEFFSLANKMFGGETTIDDYNSKFSVFNPSAFQSSNGMPPMGVDALDDVRLLDRFSMERSRVMMSMADLDFDSVLSLEEGIEMLGGEALAMAVGDAFDGPVDFNSVAALHFGVYAALSGRTVRQPGVHAFDHKAAAKAIIAIYDNNDDEKLSVREALNFGLSAALVGAIDDDMDSNISAEELHDAQLDMIGAGCAGETVITDRHAIIHTKPPLSGKRGRNCSFIVLPEWFYPKEEESTTAAASYGRRTASLSSASKNVVVSHRNVHIPNRLHRNHKVQKTLRHSTSTSTSTSTRSRRDHTEWREPSPLEEGELDANVTMTWLVSVETGTEIWISDMDMYQYVWRTVCSGAIIDRRTVMTSGHCGSVIARLNPYSTARITLRDGTTLTLDKAGVMQMPGKEIDGNSSIALLKLTEDVPDNVVPVQLHDGSGLSSGGCDGGVIMAVGLQAQSTATLPPGGTPPGNTPGYTPGTTPDYSMSPAPSPAATPSPTPAPTPPPGIPVYRQSMMIVDDEECEKTFEDTFRFNPYTHDHMCITPTFIYAQPKCYSGGSGSSFVVAAFPNEPSKAVLMGVNSYSGFDVCNPMWRYGLYTKVASALNWILSAPSIGRFPPLLLSVETAKLVLGDGDAVRVSSGAMYEVGSVTDRCEPGGTYYDEESKGWMRISIESPPASGHQMAEIKFIVDANECGNAPAFAPGASNNAVNCEKLPGCTFADNKCSSPSCQFSLGWKEVTQQLQANGMAFTGGLGGQSVVDGMVEYRQWMCARDWNVTEQLSCGVGPGELACFRFDEKAEPEDGWDFMGRNSDKHVKLVSPAKRMEGVMKQMQSR